MKLLMLFIIFLCLGALFIISNENLYLKNKEDASKFVEHYYGWLGKLYQNTAQVTGNIIKTNWMPDTAQ